MQAENILQADMLDILFEHKNKAYGAYQLRRSYNKRLYTAIGIMVGISSLFFVSTLVAGSKKAVVAAPLFTEVDLKKIEEPKAPQPKMETPQPAKPVEPVKTIKVTPPVIIPDNQVKPEDEMKSVDDMDKAKIGTIDNPNGKDDPNAIAPPVIKEAGTGIGAPVKQADDVNDIFAVVQAEAKFPGGIDAWRKYLERNLNRDLPVENGAPEGSVLKVVVSFVVSRENGAVSEVKAENDPGYGTAAEAVRVIQRGPHWQPALQNGRNVNYRQRQTIIFQVNAE